MSLHPLGGVVGCRCGNDARHIGNNTSRWSGTRIGIIAGGLRSIFPERGPPATCVPHGSARAAITARRDERDTYSNHDAMRLVDNCSTFGQRGQNDSLVSRYSRQFTRRRIRIWKFSSAL